MADLKKISELPPSIAASEQDIYPVVQNGNTLNQTLEKLRQAIIGGWQTHVSSFLSSADALSARTSIGLGAVNNTADASKPVSADQQAALDTKVSKTGNETVAGVKTFSLSPVAPTPAASDVSTKVQTTAGSKAQMGLYGLGLTALTSSDPDLVVETMLARYTNSTLNTPVPAQSGTFLSAHYSSTITCQLAMHAGQSTPNPGLFYRVKLGGLWGSYAKVAFTDAPTFTGSLQCSGPVRTGQFTLSTLPSASTFSGYTIDVTNAAGGQKTCRSDGTDWKILNTTTTVS